MFTLGLPQKKTMSGFVGEKLQKKLKKLKHRKESAEKGKMILFVRPSEKMNSKTMFCI